MMEGLEKTASDVKEAEGGSFNDNGPIFDTSEEQDYSGLKESTNNDFSEEIDFSGDSSENLSDKFDTSQEQDYSGDDLYNSEDFASEKDGNKESEGQIKENAVAEENKPKESVEQLDPKNGEGNSDTSKEGLTDEEKDLIKNEVDDSDENNETEDAKTSYEIQTRNESLEDDVHPITGVPFERKTVEDKNGNEVTGVFPVFDSKFDAQLPEDKIQASDKIQFEECNKQLANEIENNPELAKQFTPEQLEQIKNGETPDGFTWHHNEEKGKMQLVDSDVHEKTGHTGGKLIWGGGTENR